MQKDKISWVNHFIELIVVFIGITLAFMLNNWREDYKSQRMEAQYMNSFYNEISESGNKLDSILVDNQEKSQRLATALKQMQADNFPIDSAINVVADLARISLFIPRINTYESIRNSGNLNLISDYQTRLKIIAYYESFSGKALIEEYYRNYIDDYFIPFFLENVDLISGEIINKNSLNSVRFRNMISGYYQLHGQLVENYEEIQKLNIELRTAIENSYASSFN